MRFIRFKLVYLFSQIKIHSEIVKKELKKVNARKVILRGPSEEYWSVKVFKTKKDVFLGEGWQRFVKQNFIQEKDFLLFKYDGVMCFTVQIYDKSGLERGKSHPEHEMP